MYTVIYQLSNGQQVTLESDHLPFLGLVVPLPDNSGRYGEVLSTEKSQAATDENDPLDQQIREYHRSKFLYNEPE